MKALVTLLCLLTSTAAFAAAEGNDGPFGAPHRPDHPAPRKNPVVAEVSVASFFAHPAGRHTVSVHANGDVMAKSEYRDPRKNTSKRVAKLESDVVEKLRENVDELRIDEVVDMEVDRPQCLDAPTTTYVVYPGLSGPQEIGRKQNCHDYRMKNYEGTSIISLLQGLQVLGRF